MKNTDTPKLNQKSITLRREFFEHEAPIQDRVGERQTTVFIFTGVDIPKEGGIYRKYKDVLFNMKGFPQPNLIYRVDIVKKYTMAIIENLAQKWVLIPLSLAFFYPKKLKVKLLSRFIQSYINLANGSLESVYYKENYYCKFSREIRKSIYVFLTSYGVNSELSENFAKVIATIFEHDDAYRFRVQDILSEITKRELLKNPKQTLEKMIKIFSEREQRVLPKFISAFYLLKYLFLMKSFRQSFRKAVLWTDFKELQFDEGDKYHATIWSTYNFFGKTDEERLDMWVEYHEDLTLPEQIEITV